MTEIQTLIDDLKAADYDNMPFGDAAVLKNRLDKRVMLALGMEETYVHYDSDQPGHNRTAFKWPGDLGGRVLKPTQRVDNALELLNRDDYWIQITMPKNICMVEIGAYELPEGFPKDAGIGGHTTEHKQLALALTIAILEAEQASQSEENDNA